MTSSVLIVNFRAYSELEACLSSLRAQEAGGPVVAVVDQAPDGAELSRLREHFPLVTFIESSSNRGFAAGVNLAASHAGGESVLLLNPDCLITREAAARLASWLDAHPRVGAVGPRIRDVDGTVQASARRFPDVTTAFAGRSSWLTRAFPGNWLSRRNLPLTADLTEPSEVDWVSGACVMVRRGAFDEVGGMDAGFFLYWEDADLGRRLKNAGWTTVYHPQVEAVHVVGACTSFAPVRSAVAFHRSALRYCRKHASPLGILMLPVVAAGLGLRLVLLLTWNYSRQAVRRVFGGSSRARRQALRERTRPLPRPEKRRDAV